MQQEAFIAAHQAEWEAIAALLAGGRERLPLEELPAACRRVSQHLSLARHRGYSADLVERLNGLAMGCHQRLYRPRLEPVRGLVSLMVGGLPRAVRQEWRLVLLGHLVFYGPALAAFLLVHTSPERVVDLLDPAFVANLEAMYDPAGEQFLRERAASGDTLMFGYYIWNNVGIGFTTFASGALLGMGPLFYLGWNGVILGACSAHLQHMGMGEPFFTFVIGHSSFEITAIVLAGAAGGRLGLAWVSPGGWSRSEALRRAATRALPLIQGAAMMLVVAAVIEAYWSSKVDLSAGVKLTVGALLWLLVYAWLLLGGRRADR